ATSAVEALQLTEMLGLAPCTGQNSLDSRSFYRVYDAAPLAKVHAGFWRLEEASDWPQWVKSRLCQQRPWVAKAHRGARADDMEDVSHYHATALSHRGRSSYLRRVD